MTYDQALNEINKRLIFGSKPGLERMLRALEIVGNPHKRCRFVHVAGTNGKGTTSTYLSAVLSEAGYKTGLYTSPYVVNFRERFQINGEMIPKEELCAQVEKLCAHKDKVFEELTEFEYISVLAFQWFADSGCDIVVLEVGLGGRFDATNVIESPLAAVITSISLDHTSVLGNTVEEIAFEKAGIIKPGTALSLYPEQPGDVFNLLKDICNQREAEFCPANELPELLEENLLGSRAKFGSLNLYIPFSGRHQLLNAATALNTIEILRRRGLKIEDEHVVNGCARAAIPARMELISKEPMVILDGGHNPGCAKALKELLERHLPGKRICAIIGMVGDKDSESYLRLTAPLFSEIITVKFQNPRAQGEEELCLTASNYCPSCTAAKSIEQAVLLAKNQSWDALVVCGSLYLAGEIRPVLKKEFGTAEIDSDK